MTPTPKSRKPLPREKRRKTSLTLAPSIWDAARAQAAVEQRSIAMVVERALRAYIASARKEG